MALEDTVVELQKFFAETAPRAPFSLPDPVPLAGCQPAQRRMDDLTPEPLALRREPAAPEPPPRGRRKPSITEMIRQARKAGERGAVRVELVNADGSRAVVTSSNQPAADLMADDDAEKLWLERIGRDAAS